MGVTLDRKLTLQHLERTPDGAGGFHEVWTPLGIIWANVRGGSGRESAGQDAIISQVSYKITVRAAPVNSPQRPKANQRFHDGERIFTILAVYEQDASARYLTCVTKEEVVA